MITKNFKDSVYSSIVGGAVGDALGVPVEFNAGKYV